MSDVPTDIKTHGMDYASVVIKRSLWYYNHFNITCEIYI